MQRQIQVLWRNHIPMCIEVLLFPDCAHGLQKATSTDAVAPPVIGDGCILLEQWTIQMTAKKYDTPKSMHADVQTQKVYFSNVMCSYVRMTLKCVILLENSGYFVWHCHCYPG